MQDQHAPPPQQPGRPGVRGRPFGAYVFLRQAVRLEGGIAMEAGVSLRLFLVTPGGRRAEVEDPGRRAHVVRELFRAQRLRQPEAPEVAAMVADLEEDMARSVRRVTPEERKGGIRLVAAWPVFAAVVV